MSSRVYLLSLTAGSIAWVGIWMPCDVVRTLLPFWISGAAREEIIPLCLLAFLSLALLIGLFRNLIGGVDE